MTISKRFCLLSIAQTFGKIFGKKVYSIRKLGTIELSRSANIPHYLYELLPFVRQCAMTHCLCNIYIYTYKAKDISNLGNVFKSQNSTYTGVVSSKKIASQGFTLETGQIDPYIGIV